MRKEAEFDLLIVGGGINGAGIARDAAGRGVKTLLVDQGDFGGATSSASTKLVHGGLRYLEHYEFRLVAESLAEREVLLRLAPHLVAPLQFVMPHVPTLRPAWMIRAGLWLYDRIGGRSSLPRSSGEILRSHGFGTGLKPGFKQGFAYWDARVDDSRLVILNLRSAAGHGATLWPRTRLVSAKRESGRWSAALACTNGEQKQVTARILVNAAGPWVAGVIERTGSEMAAAKVQLVKGSHIVVPRVHSGNHAYIFQNIDKRVIFVIPYREHWSLIGTTDIAVDGTSGPWTITDDETHYLLDAVNRYLARPVAATDIVWSYAGIRPLYDNGVGDPAAITRDYTLVLDDREGAVELAIVGGKLTTYRKLAETVLERLRPWLATRRGAWTAGEPLPGAAFLASDRDAELSRLHARYPRLPTAWLDAVFSRHGTTADAVAGNAATAADLGRHFGGGLYQIEVEYLAQHEWASTADDVLWRRTKTGLAMTPAEREEFAGWFGANVGQPR
jgi:glycerol-3-phosphate dehydrogenase